MSDPIEQLLNSVEVDGRWNRVSQDTLAAAGIDITDLALRLEDRAVNIGLDVEIAYSSSLIRGESGFYLLRVQITHKTRPVSTDFWKGAYE